jgi:hypothetical protein
MAVEKNLKVPFIRPYSHKVEWTPSTVDGAITGAVDEATWVASQSIGKHEVTVDGFTADDSQEIEDAKDVGVYISLTGSTIPYRIINFEKTADLITKLWIFPAIDAAVVDDAVITVNPTIDLGLIGEDGLNINGEVPQDELIDETENIVEVIQRISNVMAEFAAISMNYENYLLIHPLSFFVIKDSDVAFKYGLKKGFANAPSGKFVISDKNNPTNKSRTVTFEEALLVTDAFEYGLGKEMMKGYPVKIRSTGDNLLTVGDEAASYS